MKTPSNAGKEPEYPPVRDIRISICQACLDGIKSECHTPGCALYLHRVDLPIQRELYEIVTPPTQSQEGETVDYSAPTPETDAFMSLIDDSEIDLGQVEAKLKQFESERNAAQRENDRLRKLIEDAPHDLDCQRERKYDGNADKFIDAGCTCWKSRAATEEGKRG